MKKRFFALALAATLTISSAVPVLAYKKNPLYSPDPSGTITPTPRTTITKRITPPISPKTGEIDYVLYGALGAAACASVVVISRRKKNEDEV